MSHFIKLILVISFLITSCNTTEKRAQITLDNPEGMIWVEGKSYTKGAKNNDAFAMMRYS